MNDYEMAALWEALQSLIVKGLVQVVPGSDTGDGPRIELTPQGWAYVEAQ